MPSRGISIRYVDDAAAGAATAANTVGNGSGVGAGLAVAVGSGDGDSGNAAEVAGEAVSCVATRGVSAGGGCAAELVQLATASTLSKRADTRRAPRSRPSPNPFTTAFYANLNCLGKLAAN